MAEVRYKDYSVLNYFAFNFAGFACIAIVVFLTATQPFYIKEVIGIEPKPGSSKDSKIGHIIGALGFFDELTSMISAPFLGGLIDKLNALGFGGSRIVQSSSFLIIVISLFGYAVINRSLIPDMFIFRCLFAFGVTACMSTVTVTLNEVTSSDFSLKMLSFWTKNSRGEHPQETADLPHDSAVVRSKKNGGFAGILGMCTGIGAIASVCILIPLPVEIVDWTGTSAKQGLKYSYLVVALFALVSMLILYRFLYSTGSSVIQDAARGHTQTYWKMIREGFEFSKNSRDARLAFAGAFVARATTVATTAFIPLVVYNFYYSKGECKNSSWSEKDSCYEGYKFAAILNGVAQTVALVSAPLWAYLVDRFGKNTIAIASGLGAFGSLGLSCNTNFEKYNPKTVSCFFFVSVIGLSQIGLVICSMSTLSGISNAHSIIGSLSGLYSFCGGIGIMVIILFGGIIADSWILGPFFVLGLFNLTLLGICFFYKKERQQRIADDESNGPIAI
ncbi:hypothetical protein KGF56_000033 [Candida oxycetoniae]|uniref:Major facilitator superfamily (MFS) profile domain-containing protein n=1 Tax=Candida oxycetoniae TaxID=497107 RepID=A0AAI9T1G1_9ASCO|nr:uncharacterized protein KGF56_000033 [Candida oxycetoniae]KAI3407131.2 hypothetical protein KGF56_000033 [Candida oxycetoniae]